MLVFLAMCDKMKKEQRGKRKGNEEGRDAMKMQQGVLSEGIRFPLFSSSARQEQRPKSKKKKKVGTGSIDFFLFDFPRKRELPEQQTTE